MPVSESWWPASHDGSHDVSHDASMKRKAPMDEMPLQWCPLSHQPLNAKRPCLWPPAPQEPQPRAFQAQQTQQTQEEEAMEDANANNNCSSMQDLNCSPSPQQFSMWPGNSCGQPTTQSQNTSSMQDGQPMNGQLMDLCGETFNPQASALAELQEAHISMDSDCVPNSVQYDTSGGSPPGATPSSRSDCSPQLCCGIAETSPSSKVRCFCKPNWDGSMSLRPYVSDIY